MLDDARRVPRDKVLDFDLCIVGAGPVGITLARELRDKKLNVCLLESGGFEMDPKTQALYEAETTGTVQLDPGYCTASRQRYFGGTTNTWTGMCRALDEIDFEERPWVPNSGWPFGRKELLPYYDRAAALLEVTGYPEGWGPDPHPEGGTYLCEPGSKVRNIIIRLSPPVRFGQKYRDDIVDAPDIRLFLHANVTELTLDPGGATLESVLVRTLSGNRFRVRARAFVLAAGGIETVRLLLCSDGVHKNGVGNQHDLVGRYFMEHAHIRCGFMCFLPREPGTPAEASKTWDQVTGDTRWNRGLLSISEDEQRRSELLNLCTEAYTLPRNMMTDFVRNVGATATRIDRPGVDGMSPFYALLFSRCEQAPNHDSRVFLVDERDALGMRRVKLDWRLRDEDRHSVHRSLQLMAAYLGAHGWGRAAVHPDLWNSWLEAGGGSHHMGTTRMHDDPKRGVTDAHGRVHSVDNLFIGGSSLNPTVGFANPLMTALALVLRQSEHLAHKLEAA